MTSTSDTTPAGTAVTAVPLARDLARFGSRPALLAADAGLSYAELGARVEDVARRLGTGRRLVLLAARNEVDTVVAYLAALSAGHPVLLAPAGNPAALASLVAAYDPDVVVGALGGPSMIEERRAGSVHQLHPDLAVLLSTSGSTGSPKLVRLSHLNIQSNAESIAAYLGIRDDDRAATTLPIHYCYGLSVLNSHLVRGAAVALTDLSVVDACFWRLFREARCTTFAAVPHTIDLLERVGFRDMDLPCLRYVTQAGGRLAPRLVREYARLGRRRGWDLVVMYGQTEATARMAYLPPDLADGHPESIGVAVPGGSLWLEPAPGWEDTDAGELTYAGPNVMLGYAEEPEDLRLGRTVDVLRTGDVARRNEAGLYELVGRRSRFVKVVGQRIDLDRLETLLDERGLRGYATGADGELVVAVEGRPDAARLRRELARQLGLPAPAVRVHTVDVLPRLRTGKPDYAAVARLGSAQPATVPSPRPGQPQEAASLRALFAELLDRDDVTDASSFVSLGGDSLSYVEMSLRLEDALGQLPPGWHTLPISELAARTGHARRQRQRHAVLETSVALRAAAIVLIVGSHSWLFDIRGGAHVLLAVAGFNVARFQLTSAGRRTRARRMLQAARRVALPSVVWIAIAYVLTEKYRLANVFLLNTVLGPDGWGPEWHFWFIEALVYMVLALAAVLSIPAVDRLERRFPFGLAMGFVLLGLVTRYDLVSLDIGPATQAPHVVFWCFALGWAAARAAVAWQRALVCATAVATVPGFFDDAGRAAVVVSGIVLLVWFPGIASTPRLNRVAGVLAGGSLYVYLTHWVVFPWLDHVSPLLATIACFAVGIAYWQVAVRVGAAVRHVPRRLAPPVHLAGWYAVSGGRRGGQPRGGRRR